MRKVDGKAEGLEVVVIVGVEVSVGGEESALIRLTNRLLSCEGLISFVRRTVFC